MIFLEKGIRGSTICNGQSKLIACLPEEGIKVHYAFYGKKTGKDCKGDLPYKDESPTCSALDAKSNVENSCNGKQTCLLFADDNIYGKSLCPNVNKYLYLKYSCIQMPTDLPSMPVKLTPQEDLEEDAVSRSTTPGKCYQHCRSVSSLLRYRFYEAKPIQTLIPLVKKTAFFGFQNY